LIQVKDASTNEIRYSIADGEAWNVIMENEWGMGINPPQEILLGETIYFQAVKDPIQTSNNEKNIIIVPLKKLSDKIAPTLQDAKFKVAKIDGDELGVYYDEYKDEDGNKLESGIIRLIGRYWRESEKHTVMLTAKTSDGSRSGHMLVEVKKPAQLFDKNVPNNKKPYTTTINIKREPLNIDELCIKYADSIGISPQFIKGQMFQESDHTGGSFNPSYRYEPWRDQYFADPDRNDNWKYYKKQPFWITDESPMGDGEVIPMDHQNVHPIYYPTDHLTQAQYALNHWNDMYWDSKKIEVIGSSDLTIQWWQYYIEAYISSLLFTITPYLIPDNFATNTLKDYIQSEYTDYAQTRKCASYGLIQILYTTAYDQGYNKGLSVESSSAPENLNYEKIEMPLYKSFTLKNLHLDFGENNSTIPEGNWPKGWEKTWKDSWKRYNHKSTYGSEVLNNSKKFYPQAE